MNFQESLRSEKAFTLPEVTLAIGIVALGLVGVFSILPFGLTAQKDNREETIIRYEVQFWREALLSDGLLLDELKRVERVELYDINSSGDLQYMHRFKNPYRSSPTTNNLVIVGYDYNATAGNLITRKYRYQKPNPVGPGLVRSDSINKARTFWASDVCGWLLKPVFDPNLLASGVGGNYALVKAINGPLFDRLYGAEPETEMYHFPNRDFAMGYILQVQPEKLADDEGSRINVTFHWPIFEEVSDQLKKGVHLNEVVKASMTGNPVGGSGVTIPRMKTKSFMIRIPRRISQALLESDLTLQERRFMKEMRNLKPGDPVKINELRDNFSYYDSSRHFYGANHVPRVINNDKTTVFKVEVIMPSKVRHLIEAYPAKTLDPSFLPDDWLFKAKNFPLVGHSGMWLRQGSQEIQIGWVAPDQKPLFGNATGSGYNAQFNLSGLPATGSYAVSFLKRSQDWEILLKEYALGNSSRTNLVTEEDGRYYLKQRLRYTTHRPATGDERAYNNAWSSGQQEMALWDWVPDERMAPRLWRIE